MVKRHPCAEEKYINFPFNVLILLKGRKNYILLLIFKKSFYSHSEVHYLYGGAEHL